MKRLLLVSAFFMPQFPAKAQTIVPGAKTIVYLVRHSEKEKGEDPLLTAKGSQRAGDLMRVLKSKKLRHVYVTQYRRTQMTSDSIRIELKVYTVHYNADTTGNDLLEQVAIHHDFGNSILVIGHSNTIPVIIKRLGVKTPVVAEIPDNEFDNLFVVTIKKGKATLSREKYGSKSAAMMATQPMQPLQ